MVRRASTPNFTSNKALPTRASTLRCRRERLFGLGLVLICNVYLQDLYYTCKYISILQVHILNFTIFSGFKTKNDTFKAYPKIDTDLLDLGNVFLILALPENSGLGIRHATFPRTPAASVNCEPVSPIACAKRWMLSWQCMKVAPTPGRAGVAEHRLCPQ